MFDNLIFRYGTVTGPGTSTNNALVLWDGTSGRLIKNSTVTVPTSGFLGDVVGPAYTSNNGVAVWDGTSGRLLKNGMLPLPTSAIVGINDTQTLINKRVILADNTGAWSGAAQLEVRSASATEAAGGTGGAFMSFHRVGSFASNFGVDSTNTLRWAGYSLGSDVPWSVTSTGHMKIWRSITFPTHQEVTATTASTLIDFNVCQKMHLRLNTNTTVSFAFPGIGHYQIIIYQTTANMTVTWTWPSSGIYWLGSATAHPINMNTNTFTVVNIYYCHWGIIMSASKAGNA